MRDRFKFPAAKRLGTNTQYTINAAAPLVNKAAHVLPSRLKYSNYNSPHSPVSKKVYNYDAKGSQQQTATKISVGELRN
jgi:hypothetical protein